MHRRIQTASRKRVASWHKSIALHKPRRQSIYSLTPEEKATRKKSRAAVNKEKRWEDYIRRHQ